MAKAFPKSQFFGYNVHAESIAEARELAARQGVWDRVPFEVAKATAYQDLRYGLVTFFDCLHDPGDPVSAVEPFAQDRVEDDLTTVRAWPRSTARLVAASFAASCRPRST
jgi:hypothetical protein